MVRHYGFYSNKLPGLCKKTGTDDQVPALIESDKKIQLWANAPASGS